MRVDSQLIATLKPPQGYLKAPTKRQQSQVQTRGKRGESKVIQMTIGGTKFREPWPSGFFLDTFAPVSGPGGGRPGGRNWARCARLSPVVTSGNSVMPKFTLTNVTNNTCYSAAAVHCGGV